MMTNSEGIFVFQFESVLMERVRPILVIGMQGFIFRVALVSHERPVWQLRHRNVLHQLR